MFRFLVSSFLLPQDNNSNKNIPFSVAKCASLGLEKGCRFLFLEAKKLGKHTKIFEEIKWPQVILILSILQM